MKIPSSRGIVSPWYMHRGIDDNNALKPCWTILHMYELDITRGCTRSAVHRYGNEHNIWIWYHNCIHHFKWNKFGISQYRPGLQIFVLYWNISKHAIHNWKSNRFKGIDQQTSFWNIYDSHPTGHQYLCIGVNLNSLDIFYIYRYTY